MVAKTLERKVTNGSGLNTQEKGKLLEVFKKHAYKTNTTLIALIRKGEPVEWTYIIQNGAGYKVKSSCIEEGTYKISTEKIKKQFIRTIKKKVPGCVGLRGKIKGYQIKELIILKNNY